MSKNLEQHIRETFTDEKIESLNEMNHSGRHTYNRKEWENEGGLYVMVFGKRGESAYFGGIDIAEKTNQNEEPRGMSWMHPLGLAQAEKQFPLPQEEWTDEMLERFQENLKVSDECLVLDEIRLSIFKVDSVRTDDNEWLHNNSTSVGVNRMNCFPKHFTEDFIKNKYK